MIGLLYLFASMARSRGRAVQHMLKQRWGGFRRRSFCDFEITRSRCRPSVHTTRRCRTSRRTSGSQTPRRGTVPDAADGISPAAIRRLFDLRRGPKHPLIHNDNIAYGFWRNLLGMRGAALVLAVCASAAIVVMRTTQMTTGNMPLWAIARDAPATQVAAVVLLFLWITFLLIIVRPPRVWDAGVAYAERLLASLPLLLSPAEGPSTERREPRRTLKS